MSTSKGHHVGTLKEVAAALGVTEDDVRQWRRDGICPPLLRHPIDLDAVRNWIQAQAEKSLDAQERELSMEKLRLEVEKLQREKAFASRDKMFWVAVASLGMAVLPEVRAWLSGSPPPPSTGLRWGDCAFVAERHPKAPAYFAISNGATTSATLAGKPVELFFHPKNILSYVNNSSALSKNVRILSVDLTDLQNGTTTEITVPIENHPSSFAPISGVGVLVAWKVILQHFTFTASSAPTGAESALLLSARKFRS